jgi:hypothetical protein
MPGSTSCQRCLAVFSVRAARQVGASTPSRQAAVRNAG